MGVKQIGCLIHPEISAYSFKEDYSVYKHCFSEGPLNEHKQINEVQFFDEGGKQESPEKKLWKQVWTENQMDIHHQDQESNAGPVVHSPWEVLLCYRPQLKLQHCDKLKMRSLNALL